MTEKKTMDKAAAAELLGHPAHEVADVTETPAGTVVVMHAGHAYIVVSKDRPDGAGRHGVMYHKAPKPGYSGSFPVYTPTPEERATTAKAEAKDAAESKAESKAEAAEPKAKADEEPVPARKK